MAGQSTPFGVCPMQLEHLLQALDLVLGFREVRLKALLELRIGRLVDHLRQRLRDLVLGIVDVLQRVHEQVVKVVMSFEKSPMASCSLCEGGWHCAPN